MQKAWPEHLKWSSWVWWTWTWAQVAGSGAGVDSFSHTCCFYLGDVVLRTGRRGDRNFNLPKKTSFLFSSPADAWQPGGGSGKLEKNFIKEIYQFSIRVDWWGWLLDNTLSDKGWKGRSQEIIRREMGVPEGKWWQPCNLLWAYLPYHRKAIKHSD